MQKKIKIIKDTIGVDNRGQIWTSWNKNNLKLNFNHDKFTISKKRVFRGFHFDSKTWKLISCVYGKVFLFYFKIEKEKKYKINKITLSHKKNIKILIPPGFAIGYLSLKSNSVIHYKLSYKGEYIDSKKQGTIKWNDPRISVKYLKKKMILSNRDS